MAASQSGAQNVYIFLAGPDNQGSVSPGAQPPILALLANGGASNPIAVAAVSPEAAVPQYLKGACLPAPRDTIEDLPREVPIPVRANQFCALSGPINGANAATLATAMSNGQQLGGAAPRNNVGF